MKVKHIYFLLGIPLLMQSCVMLMYEKRLSVENWNRYAEKLTAERAIKTFDTTNFSAYKGKYISALTRGIDIPKELDIENSISYTVYFSNSPNIMFLILYNEKKDSILRIIRNKSDVTNSVDLVKFTKLIQGFRKYKISVLEVDKAGNVYSSII